MSAVSDDKGKPCSLLGLLVNNMLFIAHLYMLHLLYAVLDDEIQ